MKNSHEVSIKTAKGMIRGDWVLPPDAKGVVLFAHGSGSGRLSPRNQYVAKFLNKRKWGTLLIDLLTEEEEKIDDIDASLRFDIRLLTERLKTATEWLLRYPAAKNLKIGYFGASTGAAAALAAAAEYPGKVEAVVSRGGRPDLAYHFLARVQAPVLLIVGGNDFQVLELNKGALEMIGSQEKRLAIVPGATHLFEEPGALEKVAQLAADWFDSKLYSLSEVRFHFTPPSA